MANIYVGQLKDLLRNFYNRTQSKRKEIEANNAKYSADYVVNANSEVMQRLALDYENTLNSINNIFTNIRTLLAKGNFPNVEGLTADRLFFDKMSPIRLTRSDVEAFAERYEGNFSMSRLVSDWIDFKKPHKADEPNPYAGIKINTPRDYLDVYQKFFNSGASLATRIYSNDVSKIELDNFADESFAQDLFAIIGDGRGLDNYKTARVPESAAHCFDDVNLRF